MSTQYAGPNHNQRNSTTSSGVATFAKTKRPYDPTDNRTRGYKFLWAVYPDYWKDTWGQKPVLGYVRADSEFHAVYAAYDKGLSHPNNCTFGLEVVQQDPSKFIKRVRGN
jgi:hypothetical protein